MIVIYKRRNYIKEQDPQEIYRDTRADALPERGQLINIEGWPYFVLDIGQAVGGGSPAAHYVTVLRAYDPRRGRPVYDSIDLEDHTTHVFWNKNHATLRNLDPTENVKPAVLAAARMSDEGNSWRVTPEQLTDAIWYCHQHDAVTTRYAIYLKVLEHEDTDYVIDDRGKIQEP